ncbi:MAG TPA: M1 family aminopeptidase [bacterium]|nr:M1 family aminopeptidase [bacterium]
MFRLIFEASARRWAWSLVALAALLWAGVTLAQPVSGPPERMGDVSRQLAQAKARFFARMAARETQMTASQASYDVSYYHLNLTMTPSTKIVSGTVRMEAQVVAGPISSVDVDLYTNMVVDSVKAVGGGLLANSHANDILTITLDRAYSTGEHLAFDITYHGTPSSSAGAFGFDTHAGLDLIWSLSEPFGARSWWPCKDYPDDKADSVDISIRVPSSLIVASNGLLRSTTDNGDGTKTYNWAERYPIATYLVSVAIYPYTVFSRYYHYSPTDSMEIRNFIYPDHVSSVTGLCNMVPDMITAFAGYFGQYPFINEKYGQAEFNWSGGMEHQTCTSLGAWAEYIVCHELSHMWWGDMITCKTFNHVWLNEGFATYAEALWAEHAYGWSAYEQQMQSAKYLGPGTIYCPDLSDWDRIFDSNLSYNKASWVLHMLRGVVGDSTFFSILKTYHTSQYEYGSCTTEEFRDICEQVSGRDLHQFFHEWIYEEGFPEYMYSWSSDPVGGGYSITLDISQLQQNYVFNMPIRIAVTTAVGETTLVVGDSLATQQFTLAVNDQPTKVDLDKDEWILRMVSGSMADARLDRGILVVNGVEWSSYGTEITTAYADSIFWGSLPISFWDIFAAPSGGYPSNLPHPLGHGDVPADTLKRFSAVVWIGNNYDGDLASWYNAPIMGYLKAGGNVLLLTRMGQDFVYESLREYLGIQWAEAAQNTTGRATSVYTGLVDMAKLGTQSYNAVFDTSSVGGESRTIFVQLTLFAVPRGLGVWRHPSLPGTVRPDGGQCVFISGRPYRYNHAAMRSNCEYILRHIFGEPYNAAGVVDGGSVGQLMLSQNTPNPFGSSTRIAFSLPKSADVKLGIYDVRGRELAALVNQKLDAGKHDVVWNGQDQAGRRVAAGVYWCLLESGDKSVSRKMVVLK